MTYFMSHDTSQFCLVLHQGHDAGKHRHLPPWQAEGILLRGFQDNEFPLEVILLGNLFQSTAHTCQSLIVLLVLGTLVLFFVLLIAVKPKLILVV